MEPPAFERMNETDVREEVIAPLLRRLGYQSGTRNDVVREQLLRYPRLFIGRKDRQKDPELRGKADYILEVDKRVRWVIEAKAPAAKLGLEEIEQAWTYANHPEVRAVYFAICNGPRLVVYRTAEGPECPPVLSLEYEQIETLFQSLDNLLGRDALLRDFPTTNVDVGLPIAIGLRSVARVTNGIVRFENNSSELSVLNELQTNISSGAIERDERDRLVAFLTMAGPTRSIQRLSERLGLASFEMISEDRQLSSLSGKPTVFHYQDRIVLPKGEKLLDLQSWREIELPFNIVCDVKASAEGTYSDRVFAGTFRTVMRYVQFSTIEMSGSFEMHLA